MSAPQIGFAGMTHLGINSAAAAAARGFQTLWFDTDTARIAALAKGELPVVEPDLPETIAAHGARIRHTSQASDLRGCAVVYIACDVPTDDRGGSDLLTVDALIETVSANIADDAVLVILCQVPPGFTRRLARAPARLYYQVETLIFGRAMERALHPERFIIGCADPAQALPAAYHEFLTAFGCPLLPMRYESAELAKIAINCCLVSSVTVANTLAELSERIGADWHEIVPALKLDRRIGPYSYLAPGLGLAGGNLERDLATVLQLAGETGSEAGLITSFVASSRHRKDWVLRTLHREVFARQPQAVLGILGLAYKENTHSTKNSPALALIRHLAPWQLRIHDPVVPVAAAQHARAVGCDSPLAAATGADALVIMTPWPAFRELKPADLARAMRGCIVIDPLRVLDGRALVAAGFEYLTLGAPPQRPH
ncbi:MAG TPA: nucleotide sugar dehydrogenase [Burkholderiales bacterium]|nr:nucleotide sugar dehydrogenase [Burkholderiales bacterium]